jgi:lysyl-tRNA synthetase class 2
MTDPRRAADDNADRRAPRETRRDPPPGVAFPNDFKPRDRAADLRAQARRPDERGARAARRQGQRRRPLMLKRVMGKASFGTLQDATGRIQLFVTKDALGEPATTRSSTGTSATSSAPKARCSRPDRRAVGRVLDLRLLTKSLRPLPDKFHGMADQEQKYRQRYVDLITDEEARLRFVARSKAIGSIRHFMVEHGFIEVETPMLHPIPGGANAKPFVTHHNALDQQMFLRIAPELYLKRLIVGGFERVFEINRSFRNEGISVRHNPEFTMMGVLCGVLEPPRPDGLHRGVLRHAARQATGSATWCTTASRSTSMRRSAA